MGSALHSSHLRPPSPSRARISIPRPHRHGCSGIISPWTERLTPAGRPRGAFRASRPPCTTSPTTTRGAKCYHKWIINVARPAGRTAPTTASTAMPGRPSTRATGGGSPLFYAGLAGAVRRNWGACGSASRSPSPTPPIPASPPGPCGTRLRAWLRMLLGRGVSLSITTKGDPSFLADLPGFAEPPGLHRHNPGGANRRCWRVLSPPGPRGGGAAGRDGLHARGGGPVVARIDPVLPHLWRAVYGGSWTEELEGLGREGGAGRGGARHLLCGDPRGRGCREVHGPCGPAPARVRGLPPRLPWATALTPASGRRTGLPGAAGVPPPHALPSAKAGG